MKFIKILLVTSLLCPVFPTFSQRVILHGDVDKQYQIPKKGANRQQYFWVQLSLFGTDLAFGELDSKQGFSNYYGLSFNQKFKVNKIISHGYGFGVHRQAYQLSKKGLTGLSHDGWEKGKLIFAGLNSNYFLRFNMDPKRGNILGKYLDIAAFGQFNLNGQRTKFERSSGNVTESIFMEDLAERYAAGGEIRLGFNNLSVYIRHKFITGSRGKGEFANLDLAKCSVGLNMNIGK